MAKNPSYPLYVRDWLCSRKILAMSGEAVKAYAYLLAESWLQEPRATLPNDDAELASMSRINLDDFLSIKNEVLQHFKIGTCREHKGKLYNERLLEISRKSENKQRLNNKNAKRTQIKRKSNANQTQVLEKEIEIEKERIIKNKKFVKPSISDVDKYLAEIKWHGTTGQRFCDWYEARGWSFGTGKPMKDWKAAVRTWRAKQKSNFFKPQKESLEYEESIEL